MVDCVNSVAKYPLHGLGEGRSTCIAILRHATLSRHTMLHKLEVTSSLFSMGGPLSKAD